MPFTQAQMDAVASNALDFYIKGDAFQQSIQEKPLLSALRAKQKTFPGGKGKISVPVQGDFLSSDANFFKGFSFSDSVTFQNPNNTKRALFDWAEVHGGITVTFTELKQDGISVVDSAFGENTTKADQREITALTGLLDSKLSDMSESWSRKMNEMFWRDGTQDSGKQSPGVLTFLTDTPTVGTTGGLNRATYAWWRNRVLLGINSSTSQILTKTLRREVRQLTRFGGKPDLILAGSAFMEALEAEISEKSLYSQSGVAGTRDVSSPVITIKGIGTIAYDPTLDDLGGIMGNGIDYSKRCYFIDTTRGLVVRVMDGEDNKTHAPARPEDKYALYRSMTWTGGMTAQQLNGCGVYSIA